MPCTTCTTALSSAVCFLVLYTVLLRVLQCSIADPPSRTRTAERLNGAVHGTVAVVLCAAALRMESNGDREFKYDADNTPLLETAMAVSVGYFVADACIMVWSNWRNDRGLPMAFLVHHMCCLMYLTCCLHLGYGGLTAAIGLIGGEVRHIKASHGACLSPR